MSIGISLPLWSRWPVQPQQLRLIAAFPCSVRNDDASGTFCLGFGTFDHDAVMQRSGDLSLQYYRQNSDPVGPMSMRSVDASTMQANAFGQL
jgi:hypothetical protein